MTEAPQSLILCNLDFEYELSGIPAPTKVGATCRRWSSVLRLLPGFERAHSVNLNERSDWPEKATRLAVWGVTPRSSELAVAVGFGGTLPELDLVRRVNDKRFSHELERELSCALPSAQVLDSVEQLELAISDSANGWVLKHPLGVSGRERMLGRCGQLSDSARGWARRKFGQGWELVFEPWVEDRKEYSFHFEITREGESRYLGHCQLLTERGVFRGNRVLHDDLPEPVELVHRVAQRVAQGGYWGPLSIDAFSGTLGQESVWRPLVEINARYSFGRLTLALGDWLPQEWCWLWWHPKSALRCALRPLPEEPSAGIYGLPDSVDPGGDSGTAILTAPTAEGLRKLEAEHLGQVF